jgi:outer membrane receptor protein involved in Fe transport
MQLRFTALKWATLASVAVSGIAVAQEQTPPATQGSPATPGDTAVPDAAAPGDATAAPSERKQAQEEIVVTGSRVRRKDLTTPAPVTVISRQQIQSSAVANIGDFLQQLPEQGNATNTQVNNGGDGETQISLRSLGAARTLVLVDGKRFVSGGSGATSIVHLRLRCPRRRGQHHHPSQDEWGGGQCLRRHLAARGQHGL